MKYVKVMTIPGRSAQVEIEDNATVADAVAKAGMTLDGYQITLTSQASGANGNSIPANGDDIVLTRQVKGA